MIRHATRLSHAEIEKRLGEIVDEIVTPTAPGTTEQRAESYVRRLAAIESHVLYFAQDMGCENAAARIFEHRAKGRRRLMERVERLEDVHA